MSIGISPSDVAIDRHRVTTLASGQELEITTLTVQGSRTGPSIVIVSGLHGDEIFTVEFCRHVLSRLIAERDSLRGRVIIVPMANSPAFEWGTRGTPHDYGNMNRVFPGSKHGGLTEQLATTLLEKVVRGSDFVLDYHAEPDTMNIRCTYGRAPDSEYGKKVHEASIATGSPVIFASPYRPGTLAAGSEQLGIPALTPELGGPLPDQAFHLEYGWVELRNLLRHVGSLPGKVERRERQWIVHRIADLRSATGGMFYPEVGFDALTTIVPRGTLLGRVLNPYMFAEQEELRAPFEKSLLMVVRGRISKVHPGDPTYIVGDAETGEAIDPPS